MNTKIWAEIAAGAGLPEDCEPIVINGEYAVARSNSRGLVFRVGPRDVRSFDLHPNDVDHAHRVAVDMATSGLHVLAPVTQTPEVRGGYLVSASPLGTPLLESIWTEAEAFKLGAELRAWADYRSPMLKRLDIPGYVRERASQAIVAGGRTKAAGEWCLETLEALEAQAPFSQLATSHAGAIHGDVHPGNMVRYKGRILLIDLDSVKIGPAMFDIAVGLMYERRFNRGYPGSLIAAGYCHPKNQNLWNQELVALQKWKEMSSFSQLLLRWHTSPGIQTEFWRRTRSQWNDQWENVVKTPTTGTSPTSAISSD